MSPGIRGRRNSIVVFVVLSLLSPATRARADAEPVLVWGTYASGAPPVAVAALSDGVLLAGPHRGEALVRFDAAGALLGAVSYGGDPEADDDVRGLASAPALGLVYLVGDARYDEGGIATPGAHQSYRECFGDGAWCGAEAFVAQFDDAGELRWGTYFGGPFDDGIMAASADASGALHVCGFTDSLTGVATTDAYQPALSGDNGGFVAKFAVDGALQWATYAEQPCLAAASDPGGDGVVVAWFKDVESDGDRDGVELVRWSADGQRMWAADFGGDSYESMGAVAVAGTGSIYLVGRTFSHEGIATPGAHRVQHGGGEGGEAYAAKFTADGEMAWATYVGSLGEGGEPAAAVDADGDLYVAFTTLSADLATTGASSSQVGEHGDALLAKFTGEGARAWAIYHGGELAETVAGVAVDPAGRIYLGGQTSSTAGIATPGASQAELASAMDPFVAMFRAE